MATAGDRPGAGPERVHATPLPEAGRVTLSAGESGHLVRSRRADTADHGDPENEAPRVEAAEKEPTVTMTPMKADTDPQKRSPRRVERRAQEGEP